MLVSGDMAYVLRLFDLLLAKGHTELQAPRDALWSWIKGFQIPNARCDGLLWVQFFEDMTWWYDRTAWAPLSLAGYLLEGQATLDPDWATDVQILLDFVAANFVPVQNGYPVCVEQDIDQIPYGGVFSTYGAVLARHASVTGSLDSRMKAYQALELLLFSIGTNGCPAEKPFSTGCGGWIEDVHLDKIHNFEDALTLFPTWQ
jgi:hypothetical protein